jgi:hypothetical protein
MPFKQIFGKTVKTNILYKSFKTVFFWFSKIPNECSDNMVEKKYIILVKAWEKCDWNWKNYYFWNVRHNDVAQFIHNTWMNLSYIQKKYFEICT